MRLSLSPFLRRRLDCFVAGAPRNDAGSWKPLTLGSACSSSSMSPVKAQTDASGFSVWPNG
jgi:hypothetical protein